MCSRPHVDADILIGFIIAILQTDIRKTRSSPLTIFEVNLENRNPSLYLKQT